MSKKCCGNCKRFENENIDGFGWCISAIAEVGCNHCCPNHEFNNNGWTEITPDNVDELYNINEDLLMIAFKLGDKLYYQHKSLMTATLNTLAKSEGYYYYVIPELKIE